MANNMPTHRAYTVRERDGADPFWTRIGSAFSHQDGKGFNIVLDALPPDGRIVLREITESEDDDEPSSNTSTTRSRRRRTG